MKNKRKKRKHTTPQHRPVISKTIDTVTPPFIHNLLCIVLPKGMFQSVDHYEAFVNKVIETEDIPDRYGALYLCCANPKCNRVIFNIKSDPHSHKEQFCYYSKTFSEIKGAAETSYENVIAKLVPETSTAFSKEHLNSPEVKRLDILTIEQLQHLWKKLIHSRTTIDTPKKGRQICFEGDLYFSPFPPEEARMVMIEEIDEDDGIC